MYVFLFTFFFFRSHSFSPWWTLAFLLIAAIEMSIKLVSFVFYLSLQLFLCYPRQCRKSKERIGFVVVVVFFLIVLVAMRFTVETRGCLKCKISPRLT